MLIIRVILLLIFLLPVNGLTNGESQTSIPISTQQNNQNPSESSIKQADKDKNGSESLKTPNVEVITQPRNQETQQPRSQKHHWYDTFLNHITDWLIAIFSGLLVLFTYRLWKATAGLWDVTDKQLTEIKASVAIADKTADAAKKSADSFQAIERARIYVEVEHIQRGKEKMIQGIHEGLNEIRVIIINEGKSLATITKFNWYVVAIDDREIDSKIAELESLQTSMIPVITIRGNNAIKRFFRFEINKYDVQRVDTSTAHYYCLGHIRYKDVFRGVRPIIFFWKDEGSYFSRDPEHSTDA